jgi:hypothetical protein
MSNQLLYTNPVYIKPWGIVVSPDCIGNMLSFFTKEQAEYQLVQSENPFEDTSISVRVIRKYTFGCDVLIERHILDLIEGAEHFNSARFSEVEAIEFLNEEKLKEEEKPKRGRRRKNDEEDDEELDAEEMKNNAVEILHEMQVNTIAVSFNLYEIVTEGQQTPFMDSMVVTKKVEGSKNPDVMNERIRAKLAQLSKLSKERNMVLNSLRTPSEEDVTGSMTIDSIDDESVKNIDRAGLERYENSQKAKLAKVEENMREIYDSLNDKIVQPFNKTLKGLSRRKIFNPNGVVIEEETISLGTLIDLLHSEALIELSRNSKGGFRAPARSSASE